MKLNHLLKTLPLLLCFFSTSQAKVLFDPWAMNVKPNNTAVKSGGNSTTFLAEITTPLDIPDDNLIGIEIPIEVTGLQGNIQSLSIELEIEHTWVGDLTATLTAPDGIAHLVVFSGIGKSRMSSEYGNGANFAGLYTFNDQATLDLWAAADSANVFIPTGEYRTSTTGDANNFFGGCTTRLNGAFSGLTTSQSNGTWMLTIKDEEAQATGQVQSAGITIDEGSSDLIFSSSFETSVNPLVLLPASDILGNCTKAQYDFTGTGFSDYVTLRNINSNLFIQTISNEGTPGTDTIFDTGLSFANTEMTSGGDFDGDGIKDFVFRRPFDDNRFQYLIRRSSRPNDIPLQRLVFIPPTNTTLDLQIGDYDGDGLDDFTFFFSGDVTHSIPKLLITESSTLNLRTILMTAGITSDYQTSGGFDKNGDQIADFMLLTSDGAATPRGIIRVYDGKNGAPFYNSGFGVFRTDEMIVPGTFIGSDFVDMAVFSSGDDNFQSYDTANFIGEDIYEVPVSSYIPITGDYDGDGIDDFGYWNIPNAEFLVRPSGSNDPDNNLITVSPTNAFFLDKPLANIRFR